MKWSHVLMADDELCTKRNTWYVVNPQQTVVSQLVSTRYPIPKQQNEGP